MSAPEQGLEVSQPAEAGQQPPETASEGTEQKQPAAETPEASQETTEAKAPRTFSQEELDEIVQRAKGKASRQSEKARQEAEYWKEVALKQAGPTPAQKQDQPTAPQREQFQDYDAYIEARAEWRAKEIARQEFERRDAERKEREQREAQDRRAREWQDRQESARDKYEDFDEVLESATVQFPQPVLDAISESDMGPDVAYFLGKNRKEAERISRLSVTAAIRELGKLEAKLSAPAQVQRTSRAPDPIKPEKGAGTSHSKDPEQMTDEEYRRWREGRS